MDLQVIGLQHTEVSSLAWLPPGCYKPRLTAMSSLVSQYMEWLLSTSITAKACVSSPLLSFSSQSNIQELSFAAGKATSLNCKHMRETDSMLK